MVARCAAIHDANNTAITVYNVFTGNRLWAALTSNVKINGISRKGATNSTVDLLLTELPEQPSLMAVDWPPESPDNQYHLNK
ncbi:putative phage related protein [Escherichia coli]|uniref:Putative phage related protein n=1 Tax=Escherichia coli TaxID=562 RepID=A0A377HH38_ECOLX|nr:putative phage related protein [Escherichia coli]